MPLSQTNNLEAISLHGLVVHRVSMDETLETIDRFISSRKPHHVVTLDSSMCVIAQGDPALLNIVSHAELVTPDSAGVLWACRRLGRPLKERVSGVEIVDRLCSLSPVRGYRLFFFGSAPGVAQAAAERMRSCYPGCQVVGTRDGFFTPDQESEIVEQIKVVYPDIICVALGIPRQEKWIHRFREELHVPVLIGVGGTFDVYSGRVKRAPVWMQRLNLEWLYRLLKNPRKIGKVMMLPKFVLMTLRAQKHAPLSSEKTEPTRRVG
jgi:N-acetylglucosaminyldiphosphoundecaprenol N-acetyl-beta-D-mannosaminyltransferase